MRDFLAAGEWRTSPRRAALLLLTLVLTIACLPLSTQAPTQSLPETPPAWHDLDDTWGPYLAEREWGNPREATNSDGWSLPTRRRSPPLAALARTVSPASPTKT